jgi:putative transcription factor
MGTTAGQRGRKLEEETETFRVEKVSLSMAKRIQKARMDKGMSQKELARLCNMKPTIIQNYENGKAVPAGRIIQNIERQLGLPYGAISGKKRKGKGGKKKK